MNNALRSFLSEQAITLHTEYLRNLRLKYSILEKSIPALAGVEPARIPSLPISPDEREDAIALSTEILMHEVYFDSFTERTCPCPAVAEHYGSEASFLYELFKLCRAQSFGFVFISLDRRKRPTVISYDPARPIIPRLPPILAVDLCEHASFLDYGFERERYLEGAISHLDLSKLSEYAQRD